MAPMARQKQEVEKVAPGEVVGGVTPLAQQMAKEVRSRLESSTRVIIGNMEPANMSLRQRQKVVADCLVTLFTHEEMLPRYIEWSLQNPGKFGAQVVAANPKQMEIEQTNLRERVIVVGQASEAEWQEAVKSLSDAPQSNLPWAIDGEVVDGSQG